MNGGGSLEAAKIKCAKETKCRGFYKSKSYHSCMGPVRQESSTHGSVLYVKGTMDSIYHSGFDFGIIADDVMLMIFYCFQYLLLFEDDDCKTDLDCPTVYGCTDGMCLIIGLGKLLISINFL